MVVDDEDDDDDDECDSSVVLEEEEEVAGRSGIGGGAAALGAVLSSCWYDASSKPCEEGAEASVVSAIRWSYDLTAHTLAHTRIGLVVWCRYVDVREGEWRSTSSNEANAAHVNQPRLINSHSTIHSALYMC